MTLSIATSKIMTPSIMTLSITTSKIMTLAIVTLSITAVIIKTFSITILSFYKDTLGNNTEDGDTPHKSPIAILKTTLNNCFPKCHFADCRGAIPSLPNEPNLYNWNQK
jgi:hypothetical protein